MEWKEDEKSLCIAFRGESKTVPGKSIKSIACKALLDYMIEDSIREMGIW